ncbi:MAG: hypothetical protein CMN75_08535, partial [Spirochaeta sp.]|nr:hypothetical protein [Spirochaeta sp.]
LQAKRFLRLALGEEQEVGERIRELISQGKRPREVAAQLSALSELPRREIYARAVAMRETLGTKGTPIE